MRSLFLLLLPVVSAGLLTGRAGTSLDPSQIPDQCTTQCTTIVTTLNSCTTTSCICTDQNGKDLEACVSCLVSINPSASMAAEGHTILNAYGSSCAGTGVASLSLVTTTFSATTAIATKSASSSSSTKAATGALGGLDGASGSQSSSADDPLSTSSTSSNAASPAYCFSWIALGFAGAVLFL
ncbi:hypothetical protein C8J56DRAFT_472262 [Mycena floridula]|nr:hypothetical protein C8J56DRAFT_472262 [Mycena floridula]